MSYRHAAVMECIQKQIHLVVAQPRDVDAKGIEGGAKFLHVSNMGDVKPSAVERIGQILEHVVEVHRGEVSVFRGIYISSDVRILQKEAFTFAPLSSLEILAPIQIAPGKERARGQGNRISHTLNRVSRRAQLPDRVRWTESLAKSNCVGQPFCVGTTYAQSLGPQLPLRPIVNQIVLLILHELPVRLATLPILIHLAAAVIFLLRSQLIRLALIWSRRWMRESGRISG
jgi:hypothetical protein